MRSPLRVLLPLAVAAVAAAVAILDPFGLRRTPTPDLDLTPAASPGTPDDAGTDAAPAPLVRVGPAPGAVDPTVPPATPPDPAAPRRRTVEVVVLADANGVAVVGASVRVSAAQEPGTPEDASGGARSAATGPDGRARVEGEWGEAVDVRVTAEGFADTLAAGAPADEPLTIRLRPGAAIEGRVTLGDATPAAGASVAARAYPAVREEDPFVARGVAGPDGRFRLGGLATGTYEVTVDHPRGIVTTVGPFETGARDLEVRVAPALVVSLRVRTASGKPPPTSLWGTYATVAGVRRERLGVVSVRGEALHGPMRVPVAVGDETTVTVEAARFLPWSSRAIAVPRVGGAVTLDVRLEPDLDVGSVRVHLRDAANGKPVDPKVAGLEVTGDAIPTEVTEDGWRFAEVATATARVVVFGPRHAPLHATLAVRGGMESEMSLVVEAGARLRIAVEAPGNRRARVAVSRAGLRMRLYPDGGSPGEYVLVGPAGKTVGGLGAGEYVVEVVSPDLVASPASVVLVANATADVLLRAVAR